MIKMARVSVPGKELYMQVFRSPQEWAAPQLVSRIQARV